MRNQGHAINHKRVHRLYKELKLQMRRKTKKRLAGIIAQPIVIPHQPNQIWSIDFMTDTLISSRWFRTLNIIDDFNREAVAIEAAPSITGLRLTKIPDRVASGEWSRLPQVHQVWQRTWAQIESISRVGMATSGQYTVYTAR